ncbi:hypothetical protein [Salinibacillus kushneri]|uniref:hypothetical protein n=1 Tax=Salinibacillus kushneri TaxID=237682 RepID=UPI000B859E66|nr:hypothetical protein [Salinibacillus kushneri]
MFGIKDIKITFSLSYQNRWFVLVRFNEEQFSPMTAALFEIEGTKEDYTVQFLTGKNLVPTHWYDQKHNIGYGTINSVYSFIEKVRIETE